MNERLVELYRASKPKEALVSQDEYKTANVLLGSDVERFANLIIQDCCDVLLKWKNEPFPFDEDLAASLIRVHFGVK